MKFFQRHIIINQKHKQQLRSALAQEYLVTQTESKLVFHKREWPILFPALAVGLAVIAVAFHQTHGTAENSFLQAVRVVYAQSEQNDALLNGLIHYQKTISYPGESLNWSNQSYVTTMETWKMKTVDTDWQVLQTTDATNTTPTRWVTITNHDTDVVTTYSTDNVIELNEASIQSVATNEIQPQAFTHLNHLVDDSTTSTREADLKKLLNSDQVTDLGEQHGFHGLRITSTAPGFNNELTQFVDSYYFDSKTLALKKTISGYSVLQPLPQGLVFNTTEYLADTYLPITSESKKAFDITDLKILSTTQIPTSQ